MEQGVLLAKLCEVEWARRSGSARKSISAILPFLTVMAAIENGRPWRKLTIPAAPLMSASHGQVDAGPEQGLAGDCLRTSICCDMPVGRHRL
jgi:hypothetical protein